MSTLKFRSLVEMCELNWQISLTPRTAEIWKLGLSVDIRYPRKWAPHTTIPLKRDLIPEDVSHVGGAFLNYLSDSGQDGLQHREVRYSHCVNELNTRGNCLHSELLSDYRVFCGRRNHEVKYCLMGRNDRTVKSSDSVQWTDAEINLA